MLKNQSSQNSLGLHLLNKRYIKRVWRVPKDRGALEYFAALVTKALVKHGWPAKVDLVHDESDPAFFINHIDFPENPPDDFLNAAAIAVRIVARTYSLEVVQFENWVALQRRYVVTSGGFFKEVKL